MARVKFVEYEKAQGKVKEAFDYHIKKSGSVTNMKKALLNDYVTYDTMMGWYTSYDRLVEVVGERAAMILAHSVSTTNGCILCSLFFIRDLMRFKIELGRNSFYEETVWNLSGSLACGVYHRCDCILAGKQERMERTSRQSICGYIF